MKNKSEIVDYLRNQSYWLNYMADQIESGEPVNCGWCVDLEIPEYQTEVVTIHEQARLNKEHEKAIEERIGA